MNNVTTNNYITNNTNEKSTIHVIFFILSFLIVSWFFHYFEIFHFAPFGSHAWRQTDSTSFIQTYFNNGMSFFEPRVHHNIGGDGFGSPSEFPILYYLSAWIWQIFEPHDGVLRLIDYSLLLLGLFSLSKLTLHLTKDVFLALMVPLFMMGSPIIAFYAMNYIPNIPALGLCFTGVYCFYNFYRTQKRRWLFLTWFLFTFAGLLKVTVLIPYLVIWIIFFLEKINWVQFKSHQKIFKKGWWNALLFLSSALIIGSWIIWVKQYNEIKDCGIFITRSRPIWSLVEPAITETWHWIIQDGAPQYFNIVARYFIFIMVGIQLFFLRKKQPNTIYIFNLFVFLGVVGTFFVFYRQFFIHEYYAIELMVFPASVMIVFFYILKKHYATIATHWATRLVILAFVVFNLNHSKNSIEQRFEENYIFNKDYDTSTYKKFEAQKFLKELGISYPTKAIAVPDLSPNFNLNYLNLIGWSEFALSPQPFEPWVIQSFIDANAEYLILTDQKYLTHENFKDFINYPLGNFENTIFVFDLRKYEKTPK